MVALQNGAACSSVFWNVGAAVTLGASASFAGTVSAAGAVIIGASTTVQGSVSSVINSITYGAASAVVPCSSSLSAGCAVGNAGPGCSPCPIGSYSLVGATSCTQCPAGETSPVASVSAAACVASS